jgi:phosphoserine phosphatase RsbX
MDGQDTSGTLSIEWAVAARPIPGEFESGDLHLVKEVTNGYLIAVADGLGHGHAASVAARIAIDTVEANPGESAIALVKLCHLQLKHSRGVALTLATIDALSGAMTWLGVGNVEGTLLRGDPRATPPREHALPRGGVVGEQLPPLHVSNTTLAPGDTIIIATDGISLRFAEGLNLSDPPEKIAADIMLKHGKSTDDALVLVIRFVRSSGRKASQEMGDG